MPVKDERRQRPGRLEKMVDDRRNWLKLTPDDVKTNAASGIQPWERQRLPDGTLEPTLWFNRFTTFRLTDPEERTLLGQVREWREQTGKVGRRESVPGSWGRNFERWQWRLRADAWDNYRIRERIEAEEGARAEMLKRHATIGGAMVAMGTRFVTQMDADPASQLSAGEARRWMVEGSKLELRSVGLPEHLVAVAAMTETELVEMYEGLLAQLAGIGIAGDTAGIGGGAGGVPTSGDPAAGDDAEDGG